jgi:hypothetical protein
MTVVAKTEENFQKSLWRYPHMLLPKFFSQAPNSRFNPFSWKKKKSYATVNSSHLVIE